MAPKNLPPAAKQAKILEWFRESMGVYSFKELEKLLPTVGSINQMQVKDYLQALQDENQIRVEKIGSGNWYWCFVSDARKSKQNYINNLKSEEVQLVASMADMEREIANESAKHKEDNEMLAEKHVDRDALLEAHQRLLKEVEVLDKELACYSENNPMAIVYKLEETEKQKKSAVRWTDNIESMESFIMNLIGDRSRAGELMHVACGDEYVVGAGLKDL